MVGDRKDVGKVDIRAQVALEVAKGLEVYGCLVFSQKFGKG